MTTTQDYDAILIPTLPFKKLRFGEYIDQARKRKLFKGEYIDLACSDKDDRGVYRIECNLTLQALSDILLVHITTCSKLMTALETQGVVERTKTHLLVKDYEKLLAYRNEENPVLY